MWIREKTFMELIERTLKAEQMAKEALGKAENAERMAKDATHKAADAQMKISNVQGVLLTGHVTMTDAEGKKDDVTASRILDELMNGVEDKTLGRVRYTDGRE